MEGIIHFLNQFSKEVRKEEAGLKVLGMLCRDFLYPVWRVSWAELEGCCTRTVCGAVMFLWVPALVAKAEEWAWKRVVLRDK